MKVTSTRAGPVGCNAVCTCSFVLKHDARRPFDARWAIYLDLENTHSQQITCREKPVRFKLGVVIVYIESYQDLVICIVLTRRERLILVCCVRERNGGASASSSLQTAYLTTFA